MRPVDYNIPNPTTTEAAEAMTAPLLTLLRPDELATESSASVRAFTSSLLFFLDLLPELFLTKFCPEDVDWVAVQEVPGLNAEPPACCPFAIAKEDGALTVI